jgi:hypothetical protein
MCEQLSYSISRSILFSETHFFSRFNISEIGVRLIDGVEESMSKNDIVWLKRQENLHDTALVVGR